MEKFQKNVIFQGMTEDEIRECVHLSGAKLHTFPKDKIIFHQKENPVSLFVLLTGNVLVCKDSADGKQYMISRIEAGDIFGEVFVFSGISYDFYTVTHKFSEVLEIPKKFFEDAGYTQHIVHQKLMYNMLCILGKKAYKLNHRVQLLTSGTLRQKVAKLLLEKSKGSSYVKLGMTREMMANFLNVARPSLSREFTNMQKDGLIDFEQDVVKILDMDKLKAELYGTIL